MEPEKKERLEAKLRLMFESYNNELQNEKNQLKPKFQASSVCVIRRRKGEADKRI